MITIRRLFIKSRKRYLFLISKTISSESITVLTCFFFYTFLLILSNSFIKKNPTTKEKPTEK